MDLNVLDAAIFGGALLLTALIGLYFARGNKSLAIYLRADGQMSIFPVAMSLMSSCMSGLAFIGGSAEFYYQGPAYSVSDPIVLLLSGPIGAITVVPIFYSMKELSLHTYLERRFGPWIRSFLSLTFLVQILFHAALVIYVPCLALESILGLDKLHSIIAIGSLCVIYSTMGGIRAVIWTDAFLGLIMLVSLMLLVVFGTLDAGGFSRLIQLATQSDRLNFDGFLSFSLTTRHTIVGMAIGSTLLSVYIFCVNQVQMQRILSLGSLRQAQWAFVLASVFASMVSALASYLGLVIYASYRECDPFLAGQMARRDSLLLHYLALRLSRIPGLQGLFCAGLVSGSLSSASSVANSTAALIIEDYINPARRWLKLHQLADRTSICLAKLFSASSGILCTLLACLIDKSGSRLLQMSLSVGASTGVPILAAFTLGIYTRFANAKGVAFALVLTFTLALYIAVYQSFHSQPLEPTRSVYYNDQCAKIFNRSISIQEANQLADELPLAPQMAPLEDLPLKLENLSYMMVPIITFVSVLLIGSLVSLLTGGDQPDDYLVAASLRRKRFTVNH